MNKEELNKLRDLARNATHGPWIAQHEYDGHRLTDPESDNEFSSVLPAGGSWPEDTICEVWGGNHLDEENSQFIAAANPAAILELIALAEHSLSAQDEVLTDEQIKYEWDSTHYPSDPDIGPKEYEFARAILAATTTYCR